MPRLLLSSLLLLLSACGQSGALYLPDKSKPVVEPPAAEGADRADEAEDANHEKGEKDESSAPAAANPAQTPP